MDLCATVSCDKATFGGVNGPVVAPGRDGGGISFPPLVDTSAEKPGATTGRGTEGGGLALTLTAVFFGAMDFAVFETGGLRAAVGFCSLDAYSVSEGTFILSLGPPVPVFDTLALPFVLRTSDEDAAGLILACWKRCVRFCTLVFPLALRSSEPTGFVTRVFLAPTPAAASLTGGRADIVLAELIVA